MKRLGVLLLFPGWDASPSEGTQHVCVFVCLAGWGGGGGGRRLLNQKIKLKKKKDQEIAKLFNLFIAIIVFFFNF